MILTLAAVNANALDMGSVVKAQVVLGQVTQVVEKYQEIQEVLDAGTIDLDVAEPIEGASGKFLLPLDEADELTAWAEKSLTAEAGAEIGAKAGEKAAGMLAAKVPFGGLMSGAAKSKAKELGAVTAIGGWDFIKENSAMSFNSLQTIQCICTQSFTDCPAMKVREPPRWLFIPDSKNLTAALWIKPTRMPANEPENWRKKKRSVPGQKRSS